MLLPLKKKKKKKIMHEGPGESIRFYQKANQAVPKLLTTWTGRKLLNRDFTECPIISIKKKQKQKQKQNKKKTTQLGQAHRSHRHKKSNELDLHGN